MGFLHPSSHAYYPCGGTVTCALWQIQTYIYPFFNVGGGWGVHYDSTGIERLAVVFGIIIVAAVILGRFFCGWVCPFGLYLDLMTHLRKILKIKRRSFSDKFNKQLHQLSYVILAVIIIISVIFGSQAIAGVQIVPGTQKGGPVWDYYSSPFCQVCPMKPFCILAWTWPRLNEASLDNSNNNRSILSTWILLNIHKSYNFRHSYCCSILLQAFMVQNLPS